MASESSFCIREESGSSVVAHPFYPSIGEAEADRSLEFKPSLIYRTAKATQRHCFEKHTNLKEKGRVLNLEPFRDHMS